MRAGLVALLAGESTISDIVGARIYTQHAPQAAALPYLLVTQLASNENNTLDGTSELRFITFDVDCYADRSVEAEDLADAVRALVADYTGAAGDETILAVLFNDESESYEPPSDASERGKYVVTLDIEVQYAP